MLLAACRAHAATAAAAARLGASSSGSSWTIAAVAATAGRSNARTFISTRHQLFHQFHFVSAAPPNPAAAAAVAPPSTPLLMLARRLSFSAGAAAVTAAGGKAAAAAAFSSSSSASSSAASSTTTTTTSRPSPPPPLPRPPKSLSAHLKVYRQLSKARLSALVVATAAAGYVAGSPEKVDFPGLAWASLGTALCSAAANALNQAYEIRTDSLMTRTMARPLPAGRVTRLHAVAFAGGCATAGAAALLCGAGSPEAAALGLGNVFLYAAVYTPLKQFHPAATWVGAVVGAVPPLIGWAAASSRASASAAAAANEDKVLSSTEEEEEEKRSAATTAPPALPPAAFVLAAGLYFWQLPHFMSLAWLCKEDYARGGHKMLSLADATGKRTAACALRNCLYLMPLGFLAVAAGTATAPFATESAVASGVLAALAAAFWARPSSGTARALFRGSLVHLPVWMGCLLVHRVPNTAENREEQKMDKVVARIERGLARGYPAESFPSPSSSSSSSSPLPLPGPFLLPPVMPGLGGDRVSWGGLSGVGGGGGQLGGGRGCPAKAACDRGDDGGEKKAEEKEKEEGSKSRISRTTMTATSSSKRWWQVWR